MRKILALFLAAMMMLCCASAFAEGTFRVGMECNYAPYNWTQANASEYAVEIEGGGGYADGYDVQIARKIAEGLGKELVIVKTEWDGLPMGVMTGAFDAIIAGMSPTEERKATIDFTDAYYNVQPVVVVRKDGPYANAKTLADLSGASITGQLNTFHYGLIDQIPGVNKAMAMETFPAMIVALKAGAVDGYIAEGPGAMADTMANPELTYLSFDEGEGFTVAEGETSIAAGLAKGSPLMDSINEVLAGISDDERKQIMEDTIARYQAEMEDLQKSRKEIIKKAKEEAEQLVQEANARIENTIRTIKEAQAEKEKTRQARQELTEFRQSMEALASKGQEEKIARKMQKLQEKQNRKKEKKTKDTDNGLSAQEQAAQKAKQEAERLASIVPGAMVKIKGQNSVGEVLEVNGKNAVVAFGSIKTTIKVERLERTNIVPQKVDSSTKSTFVSNQTQDSMYEKKLNFKQDIDVRGMRGDEALQAVTYFIDDAILVGMSRVRILHGTGTGILRTLIRQYLQTVPGIRHFADEHVQFGGAGITVVDL